MKKIVCVVITCVLLLGLCSCSSQKDKLPEFRHTTGETTAELAMGYLEYFGTNLKDRTVNGKTGNHGDAVEFIISELKAAGYAGKQISSDKITVDGEEATVQNIVLSVKGNSSERQIIVGAHYDGNGVGDNASGTALLLATAVKLFGTTPEYDVIYIFFDAEENGLLGSDVYAEEMSEEEISKTIYMINLDSLSFGDYCNIYGGTSDDKTGIVDAVEAYEYACKTARELGIRVYETKDLDGYYKEHGTGPQTEANTLYTNPWTKENPSKEFGGKDWYQVYSPAAIPSSDHICFAEKGIPYIGFQATNWFAKGDGGDEAYSGFFETADTSVGNSGMFMNTEYDTLENLKTIFPGRAEEHFAIYAPLLEKLILNPMEKPN